MPKIAIFGDSIPITSDGVTYPQILEQSGFSVDLYCKSMSMSSDILQVLLSRSDLNQYDIVILNFGIVDSSPRPMPYWMKGKVDKLRSKFFKRLIRYTVRTFRKVIISAPFGPFVYNSPDDFSRDLKLIANHVRGIETIFVNINNILDTVNTNVSIARKLYSTYNELIDKCFGDENVIDAFSLSSKLLDSKYYMDGLHFSYSGHEYIAEELLNELRKRL